MAYANRVCWGFDGSEKRSLAKVKEALTEAVPASVPEPHGGYSARRAGRGGKGSAAWCSAPAALLPMPPASPAMSAPATAPAASKNFLKEDLISAAQVSRMVQKAKCQSRLS